MLSHTPSSLSEPDTPPRHTNSPLSAAEPCWTQRSRRREGPLGVKEGGGGGALGREAGEGGLRLYSRFLPLIPHKCARKQRATPLFFTFICPCAIRSFYLKRFSSSCVHACVRVGGGNEREREMKLHNERLRMFLEQCSFFLVTWTSCSYLRKAVLVQPAGRDDATARVSLT